MSMQLFILTKKEKNFASLKKSRKDSPRFVVTELVKTRDVLLYYPYLTKNNSIKWFVEQYRDFHMPFTTHDF